MPFFTFATRGGATLALAAACGLAQAAVTSVPAGSLRIGGTWANSSISVSGTGTLAGSGRVVGDVTLAGGGTIAPGAAASVGAIEASTLAWQAGGAVDFRLGANEAASDQIVTDGALTRQGSGTYEFRFGDGTTPPVPGMTYTLIRFASQSGFSAQDFSYVYGGSADALVGEFRVDADALRFTVISTPVELQSFGVD